jgi:aminopeptidase-like protein
MLGGRYPHALQHSFWGDSEVDTCFSVGLREHDPNSIESEHRMLVLNDERQFNAPGVRVPMLSLVRALPNCAPDFPYLEYHSSGDTAAIISADSLNDSQQLVLRMIDIFEMNRIPINNFKGEVFCSRFGISANSQIDPKASRALLYMIDKIDGTRSTVDIALECGVSFESVRALLDQLNSHELVKFLQRS